MKLQRRVYVVGGANTTFLGKFHPDFIWKKHPDFGKRENPTLEEHLAAAVTQALADAGVAAEQIDKAVVGNFVGECFANQGHLGAMLARVHDAFTYKPSLRVEGACASGGLAVLTAVDALQAGHDVALAAGVEVQTTVSAKEGADYLARAAHYATERSLDDFTFPAMFARRAKAYKDITGAGDEDLARVTVKAFSNANRNPKAHMRAVTMSLEQAATASASNPYFLGHEELKPHLKVSDCSQVSDGASAVILATDDGLKRLGLSKDDCVELLAYGHAVGPLGRVHDLTALDVTACAAREMYRDAGVGADEVDVAEVHDCFTVTELLMYEALDFVRRGQGAALLRDGATAIDGRIPVNTGGGLIAFGHPVGATGVKQVVEISRQLLGRCGDYQIANSPKLGVTANMGGDDRTSVCIALRKV
jgi:acetyl-CoA acyltransferase